MGVQIDLIVPPVILALLVVMIVRVNMFVMETSVDNRLTNDMQMFAELSQRLIHEELKMANHIVTPGSAGTPDSVLTFLSVSGDITKIQRSGKNLEVIHTNIATLVPDTVLYPSHLSEIIFDLEPDSIPSPYFMDVKIETESLPEQHASSRKDIETVRAFSENQVYLRNVHQNIVSGSP